ncbi:hypothetical protein [Metapseudomonas otitidis]|uniref:hypothetical protein n=1 Tax=Metapseudomonas otitidis TaxID=319939 RepID=UPI00244CA5EA|nr:hypothetical protein [Pseudomonas otitidis]MDG9785348.1 hypothetical protein [Pseudomonas otitidis]
MEDRELLELAARAAGYEVFSFTADHVMVSANPNHRGFFAWNPLTDDGDALRLAVKLAIEISPCPQHDSVLCEPKGSPESIITTEALDDYGTRRAIVRAAAEIGRAMK